MTAVIEGPFRYRLERHLDMLGGPIIAYFGVNPSTADHQLDDATVRKWRGFTTRAGGSAFLVGNVFALRSKDVRGLAAAADPVGPENRRHLSDIMRDADILVPCWGSPAKVPATLRHHFDGIRALLLASGKPVKIFGLTACGSPRHPLMLGYAGGLVDWSEQGKG